MAEVAYFGSASFITLITGTQRKTECDISVMHIPGSGSNIFDIGGNLAEYMVYDLYFTNASRYTDLRAMVGTSACLITWEFSGSAYLKSLNRTFVNSAACNATFATAEFLEKVV